MVESKIRSISKQKKFAEAKIQEAKNIDIKCRE